MYNPFDKQTLKNILNMIKNFFSKAKACAISFAEKSWRGAAIGSLVAMVFNLIIMGTYIKTGDSPFIDILLITIMIGLVIGGTGFLAKRLFIIVRKFNPLFVAAFFSTFFIASILPNSFFSKPFILFELVCGAIAGYAIANGLKKSLSICLILLVLISNSFIFYFLVFDGFNNAISVNDSFWKQNLSTLEYEDPSINGAFKVKELFYGSGNDKQRQEYGSQVNIKTEPVDATPFFDQSTGFSNYLRKNYWGFNSKNYPINARVWYPEGEGSFPLVLIVHGNHIMDDYSDPGYKYLGELLASRGFIVASVDENYLNGSWIGDYKQKEVFTRAWLLLKHLENWRVWNKTKGNVFFEKVDMSNIALIGHSRGGAAVASATIINKLNRYHLDAKQKFDFNFSIKGVIQIAPNDPYYPQNEIPIKPKNVNYLLLQGAYDQDVFWFLGNRVYNRVSFSDGNYHFKSALYIYGANHGQFNTAWGRKDQGNPSSWFSNLKPIMNGEEQRKIAKVYISAFLEASLKGRNEYVSIFKDYRRAGEILPKQYYINQFEDTKFKYIADYQEDFDVNTASIKGCKIEGLNLLSWSENALPFRDDNGSSQHNSGVYLGWNKKDTTLKGISQYEVQLADSALELSAYKNLFFFICNNKDDIDTVDFTIELVTQKTSVKKAFSSFRLLPPPLKTKLTKTNFIFTQAKDKPVERVLQYVEIPFGEFVKANENFKTSEINEIRFIFDRTNSGEIFLDKIGVN
jgi:dienelactone hydrolase